MSKLDENEKRNTPADWPQDSLAKFDLAGGCVGFVVVNVILAIVVGVVMVARRFL